MRDLAITAVVSLLIVLGGWRFLSYQNAEKAPLSPVLKTEVEKLVTDEAPATTIVPAKTEKVANVVSAVPSGSSVSVASQPVGMAVVVSELVTDTPVWIAIHADNKGQPGGVLGARYFTAGGKSISVGLLKPTEVGTYYAVLHTDNGNRKYANKEDAILRDAEGKNVLATFKVY